MFSCILFVRRPVNFVFLRAKYVKIEPDRSYFILFFRVLMLTAKCLRVNYFTCILIVSKQLGVVLLLQYSLSLRQTL